MDREKVMRGLECCTRLGCHHGCEYKSNGYTAMSCRQELERDALALLKEQEAVKPVRDKKTGRFWLCGNCGQYVGFEDNDPSDPNEYDNYCRECGRSVKWE